MPKKEQAIEMTELKQLLPNEKLFQTPKVIAKYNVQRKVLTNDEMLRESGYTAMDKSLLYAMKSCWPKLSFVGILFGLMPILQWLPTYSFRRDLIGDIIAGVTVAIMHIPHGMAYGMLAGVGPSNGLYMAIFPTIVYLLFGTSRHISIGTFAVASMMTLAVVQTHISDESAIAKGGPDIITPLDVTTSLAFTVGLLLLAMWILRLGTLSTLLSEALVSGFTTGAACSVIVSQLKDMFGISVTRRKGYFLISRTIIDICQQIEHTNIPTLIFCAIIIVFMMVCNEYLKPCVKKYSRFPIPAELIAVIGGTLASMQLQVSSRYNIKLIGDIPAGLPMPKVPCFKIIPDLFMESIAIAIVTYSVVMSLGLTFARKHGYEVRPNQELFAMGIGNIVCGFFSCIPLACSLSRSVIQEQTGGATQLTSLFSAFIIIIILFWAGPFFTNLPRCVLAGIIVVSLKPILMQILHLKKFAKQGKLEVLTWICTFLAVVIIDISIGLLVGIILSLCTLYVKGIKPYSCLLGVIPEMKNIYVDINQHRRATEIPQTKIFRYTGSLNFATANQFRKTLRAALEMETNDPKRIIIASERHPTSQLNKIGTNIANGTVVSTNVPASTLVFRFLILDFSMLAHIDVAGCQALTDIIKEYRGLGASDVFLTGTTDQIYNSLVHSMALGCGPFVVFPTVHDAVEYVNANRAT